MTCPRCHQENPPQAKFHEPRPARQIRRLGLGKLCRRTGQREQARGHLTTATAMYREMDMQFWLERAESESRELGA